MSVNYLDKTGATYLVGKIKTLLAGKVDTVSGKGLSTNDYTTAEQTKLSGIEAGAEVNVIESITVNGSTVTPTSKAVALTIPTALSSLSDDSTHRLVTDTEKSTWGGKQDALVFNTAYDASTNKAATMTDISDAISGITGIEFEIVQALPQEGETGVIYLILQSPAGSGQDIYDEYIWLSSSSTYEKIGSTAVDLSDYVKEEDLVAITNAEIDAMFA